MSDDMKGLQALSDIWRDALARAVLAEREACAKIAERDFIQPGEPEMDLPPDVLRTTIAAAIRDRGEQ